MIKLRVEDPQRLAPYQKHTYVRDDRYIIPILVERFKEYNIMIDAYKRKVTILGRDK